MHIPEEETFRRGQLPKSFVGKPESIHATNLFGSSYWPLLFLDPPGRLSRVLVWSQRCGRILNGGPVTNLPRTTSVHVRSKSITTLPRFVLCLVRQCA